VVDGPHALVLDERAGAGEREAPRAIPPAVGGRTDGGDVGCAGRRAAGEPDDHAFPVVAVAEAGGGRVFGEIPVGDELC